MTFLAVLGWLTAGLIAWGNAAAGADGRSVPWKWFALFGFFASLDGTLDLAKMVVPQFWPHPFDSVVRLAAYGFLLEFARRSAARLNWLRVGAWATAALPVAAAAAVVFQPQWSPAPEAIVASIAGIAAAAVVIGAVGPGTRVLLVAAAAVALIGPVEMLRTQGGTTIDGLYGLLVTGEGFEIALCAAVLAWVVSTSLWMHGVMRRRTGLFAGRPESFSPLAAVILPSVLTLTLATGFLLVNRSSERAREGIEREYLNRVRTASLAFDPELVTADRDDLNAQVRVLRKVREMRTKSDDLVRVYLWSVTGGRTAIVRNLVDGEGPRADEAAIVGVGVKALPAANEPHLLGPVGTRESAVLIASAPILATNAPRQLVGWLGLDIAAQSWLAAQASARLQTITLVGLFASLVVFFLAHQMLREYEAELLVGKERAEAADRAKDEFLAVMSHEIRTPMQSVLGYSELLSRTPLSDSQTGYLDTIRSQGRTLLRIVQDILDFSILRKSSYTLKRETVYLHRLVQSVHEAIKPLAARKGLQFEVNVGNDVPEVVLGDGVRIEQILLNLLGNGVKFTDRGSVQLDVTLEYGEARRDGELNVVLFSISDTGPGIKHGDTRRLFEPFTRLSYAEAVPREGAGLGLAIVKRLCQLMGGSVDLQSEWGRGTRFYVRLPFALVESSEPAGVPDEEPADAAPATGIVNLGAVLPLRVLVVEDNPYIRRLMVEYLDSIGYKPASVESGAEAVSRWRNYDLIIMDLRMPGMDGITAAGRIRAAAANETDPWIIGVSATLAESEISRAMMAGMNDFLGKPFFVQSLVEAIQASPLFARRTGEPASAASDAAASAGDAAVTGMSWMPDLAASGDSEIVQQAVAEFPLVMDEIEEALSNGELETAADRAHYLKNTIFALRMEPLIAPCRAVFERSSVGDTTSAQQSMETLRVAFAAWQKTRAEKAAATEKTGTAPE